jgi:hypothetical protein
MAMGRPKAALGLSPEQRAQLESMASCRSRPAELGTRVRIVLLSAAHHFLAITNRMDLRFQRPENLDH